jgi:hypothetical protein
MNLIQNRVEAAQTTHISGDLRSK